MFPDDVEIQDGAGFVRLIDQWFDTFNCFLKIDPNGKWAKNAFRVNIEKSKKLLNDVIEAISNLKVRRKKELMFWQKAIIIDCRSLIMLYDDLVGSDYYAVFYIITSRYFNL